MGDGVVITGLGVVSPIGGDEASFWSALCAGKSAAAPIGGLDTSQLQRKIGCQVAAPIPAIEGAGRAAALSAAAARQALSDAGIAERDLGGARCSVISGTTMGETEFIENDLDAAPDEWLSSQHVGRILQGTPGCIARLASSQLGAAGESFDLYGACAAGNMAVSMARRQLLAGQCDLALAGGADGFSRLAFLGFMRLRVMAAEVCRPFDERRDGLLVGEGAAFFVLERESSALARGAKIRARVAGCGTACETYHPTRPDPEGEGLRRATLAALGEAGLRPEEVDYVCAHGTGTPQNDAVEVAMMNRAFPQGVPFSSIKALTGHTMGAASAMELAACVLSLRHQTLIPTWHLEEVLQPCLGEALRGSPRTARVRHVVNNSAGFGGYNSSVVLCAA